MDVKALIKKNSLSISDIFKTFGRSVPASRSSCLVAVCKDTGVPLYPIDDNSTAELTKRGQVALNPKTGMKVHKVKQTVPHPINGTWRQNAAHWRLMPSVSSKSAYRKLRGVNKKGVPGPLHTFMERALRVALTREGFEVDPSRNPVYNVKVVIDRKGRKGEYLFRSTARDKKKRYADLLATAGDVTLYFEVVDSCDYLDDKSKAKFILSVASEDVMLYRISSNRAARLRSFDLLVLDKAAWEHLVQCGEHEKAHYLLLGVGLKLLYEAQHASEIPTFAQGWRLDHGDNNIRPAGFKVYDGGKLKTDPTTHDAKRRKGAFSDKYGSADERYDRLTRL